MVIQEALDEIEQIIPELYESWKKMNEMLPHGSTLKIPIQCRNKTYKGIQQYYLEYKTLGMEVTCNEYSALSFNVATYSSYSVLNEDSVIISCTDSFMESRTRPRVRSGSVFYYEFEHTDPDNSAPDEVCFFNEDRLSLEALLFRESLLHENVRDFPTTQNQIFTMKRIYEKLIPLKMHVNCDDISKQNNFFSELRDALL